jgi:hypothetical protein
LSTKNGRIAGAETAVPRHRRPATYLAVAGAVVLGGAVTTTALACHHASPGPAGPPQASAHAVGLTGDVDGDGSTDRVSLGRHDRLVVALGSGRTVTQLLQDGPRLEGLVDVDGHGEAIATSSGPHHRDWEVWRLHGSGLVRLSGAGGASLSVERGESTVWTTAHTLFTGILDPLQQGETRVGILARRWSLRQHRLTSRPAGVWCWDRESASTPTVCAPGRSWAYDAGPHGDLPALQPAVPARRSATTSRLRLGSDVWQLRQTPQVRLGTHRFVLLARHAGRTLRIRVPLNFPPVLDDSAVDLGHGRHGVLVSQEGGDQDSWHVYTRAGDRIVRLATSGRVDLGGGFLRDGNSTYLSWLTFAGRLYTRVGAKGPGHYRVYAWRPSDAGPGGSRTLHAVALGTVCIDDLLGTYGTCSS